MYMYK